MIIEKYYNNLPIRGFILVALSFIVSVFYLKYLNRSDDNEILNQRRNIYLLQLTYWVLFLSNFFDKMLPNNVSGFFSFELITLIVISLTYTLLLWKLFKEQKIYFGLLFFSLPLIMLFIFSLGAT